MFSNSRLVLGITRNQLKTYRIGDIISRDIHVITMNSYNSLVFVADGNRYFIPRDCALDTYIRDVTSDLDLQVIYYRDPMIPPGQDILTLSSSWSQDEENLKSNVTRSDQKFSWRRLLLRCDRK